MQKIRVVCLFLFIGLVGGKCRAGATTEEIVKMEKENGVVVPYLLAVDPQRKADIGVILFTGGEGVLALLKNGAPHPGRNFLIRYRSYMTDRGLAVAAIDPSSELGRLSDSRRMSDLHADEVRRVLADFKARTGVRKVFLVGTSRGTVSAAYVAKKLGNQIDGVVLTSSLFIASNVGSGLSGFDFDDIKVPLLFVHHAKDACHVTPVHPALGLGKKYPLILVEGMEGLATDPCEPVSAHGYLGRERQTMDAIVDWIVDGKVAPTIR